MNPRLKFLHPYPFEKLAQLFKSITPPSDKKNIAWSIGEPKHPAPDFIAGIIEKEIGGLSSYPLTAGMPELREAICDWLMQRFHLPFGTIDKEKNVIPVNGTREALFAFCQFVVDPTVDETPLVLIPNPFYQIYEGAAFLAGAEPFYINLDPKTLLPQFELVPEEIWKRCQLLYLSSPGNPSGAVLSREQFQDLIKLSDEHSFVIASDECYSEIYADETSPPCGLLEAAVQMGRLDYKNCVVFHSLSKRSSLPGMRSGFVAGDEELIRNFKLYRTYHGCAMPPTFQKASIAAWQDEEHVKENRRLYRLKFEKVISIVGDLMALSQPAGSFYLWPQTPIDDQEFARALQESQNLTVLPGAYLSRPGSATAKSLDDPGKNRIHMATSLDDPGKNRIRMALVAPLLECEEGAYRLAEFLTTRERGHPARS
jgi:N-succinyldiaminopimelate aminotransferase